MKPKELFTKFYPKHCTLLDYLSPVKDRLHDPEDTKAYNDMLEQTIVCCSDNKVDLPSYKGKVKEGFHIRGILQRVIEWSCHSSSGSSGNIISFGFELVRDYRTNNTGFVASTASTVVNKYPNSAVEFLFAKCWQLLYKRIGDDLMFHLLTDVSLFVMMKNNCYMQIAGCPMYNLECTQCEEQEDEWSSMVQELPNDYSVNMQQTTVQDIPQMPFIQSQEVLSLQQDSGQDLQDEPMQEGIDCETEVSQPTMVEEKSLAHEVERQEHESQTFSQGRKEADILVNSEEIPQNVAVPGTNSGALHSLKNQQQTEQVNSLSNEQLEQQGYKKGNGKGTKRKKPRDFEEPFAKKARRSNHVRPKGRKPKDHRSTLCSNIFCLYFPQPVLMYSTNLGNNFPKSHLLSSTPVSKRGATKLIENIFIDSEFVLDNKNEIRESGKKGKKKKTKQRLPKRFVKIKGLFEKMLKRHRKCRFGALLKHHCKGVLDISEEKEKEKAGKLHGIQENLVAGKENLAENPEYLADVQKECTGKQEEHIQMQESCKKSSDIENLKDSEGNVTKSRQEKYDRAVQNFTQRFQVVRFLVAVCNHVIPKELWGSSRNKKAFDNNLKTLINLNKGEKFTLGQMVNGIKTSDCKWLKSNAGQGKGKGTPLSETDKQKEVLYKWIWWLVRHYIMVILKCFFYITENAGQTKEIFFYCKPVWKVIHDFGVSAMKSDLLKPLSKDEATKILSSKSSLGYSNMRFLPKVQSVRPIINMKCQSDSNQKSKASINSKLRNLFEVIKFEKSKKPLSSDSTVFGSDDVYQALRSFHLKRKERQEEGNLYMVHVDISQCFDSIPLEKLYGIMEGVFEEEEYMVRRYVAIKSTNNVPRKVFTKKVDSEEDCRPFDEFLEDLIQENNIHDTIFVDQVYYTCEDRGNILALLKRHLFDNIVKIGSKFYKQVKGIAQGSIISTYLCSYFYSHMEKHYLRQVIQDESSLLMRWVDDFLFMTPDRALADTFLRIMHDGIPEYGCRISTRKTLVNYETTTADGLPVQCIGQEEMFPWCGFLIHPTQTALETKLDFSKYDDKHRNTVLRNLHSHPGRNLLEKLRYGLLNKSHPLLLDIVVNSRPTVLSNISEAFFWSAFKFYNYCRDFPKGRKIHENPSLCLRIILALPHFFCAQAKLKFKKLSLKAASKKSSTRRRHVFGVSRKEVETLCCQAYVKYLKKKPSFKTVVKALRKRIPRV